MEQPNCVQCGRLMENFYGNDNFKAPFCEFLDCPNYGLLQSGILPPKEDNERVYEEN